MHVCEAIFKLDCAIDYRGSDKRELIAALAADAAKALGLDAAALAETLMAREALGSTGMGDGAAVPHARLPEVTAPYGLMVRLRRAIDFEAIDGRPVNLVCLLLLPVETARSLNALACVARRLRDPAALARMRRAADRETFRHAFGS